VSTTQADSLRPPVHAVLGVSRAPGGKGGTGAGDKVAEAAPPGAAGPAHSDWARPAVTTRSASRIRARRAAVVLAVAAIVVAGYLGFSRIGRSEVAEDIELFKVTRRSFPIILQEKGELKAASSIDVKCELEGRSTIIQLVPEGAHVQKGDLLVELASDQIDDKIRDAEIEVTLAQAAYDSAVKELEILRDDNASKIRKAELKRQLAELQVEEYKQGVAAQLEQDTELALKKAEYLLQQAKDKLQDSEELYKQEYITKIDVEADRFAKYQAEIELKTAELKRKVAKEYTIPIGLQQAQSDLKDAEKDLEREKKAAVASEAKTIADVEAKKGKLELNKDKLAKLKDQKAKSRIIAESEGMVVYGGSEEDHHWGRAEDQIQLGAEVREQQTLLQLPDTSSMKVKIRVHEAKTERLKVGLPATVEVEGFSGRVFTGRVSKIAVLADSSNRWLNPNLKEYQTEILLDGNNFTQLKPNVTAHVRILVTEVKDALAVPVQAVFGKGESYYVFVNEGAEVRPVKVKVGLSSNEYVEIKEGLQEGQMVRMVVTDDMKLRLPEESGEPKEAVMPIAAPPASQPSAGPGSGPRSGSGVRSAPGSRSDSGPRPGSGPGSRSRRDRERGSTTTTRPGAQR
jgi:HlyD family secretion protein